MSYLQHPKKTEKGFTLIEVIMMIAILAAMVGIAVPLAGNLVRSANANQILKLSDILKGACNRYWVDMGVPAANAGNLSVQVGAGWNPTTASGWDGPYVDHPLSVKDNPTGAAIDIALFNAAGTYSIQGNAINRGNELVVNGVDDALALMIDAELDVPAAAGLQNEAGWQSLGRVEYDANTDQLRIFLLSTP